MSGMNFRTLHGFPAKMAPDVVSSALSELPPGQTILDPMCGSGTVLTEAQGNGQRALGFDMDPLAVLISRVATTPLDVEMLQRRGDEVRRRAERKLASLDVQKAFDSRTRKFIEYWFTEDAALQLLALSEAIGGVRDLELRRALYVAMSGMIIVKENGVSLAADIAHSRPHRVYDHAPVLPFDRWSSAIARVKAHVPPRGVAVPGDPEERGQVTVGLGDARRLPLLDGAVDHVVTSPPYLNAIDYVRASRFSLVWLGTTFAQTTRRRANLIGTEVGLRESASTERIKEMMDAANLPDVLTARQHDIVRRYTLDLHKLVVELRRVLRPGGTLIAVVGDSTIKGRVVANTKLLALAATDAGLQLTDETLRDIPAKHRYLPPPSNDSAALAKRMKSEAVLTFIVPTG